MEKNSNSSLKDKYNAIEETLQSIAGKLSLSGTREIRRDDVVNALFLLWEVEKNLYNPIELYFNDIDVDSALGELKNFNFAELQKTIFLNNKPFRPMFVHISRKAVKSPWKVCSRHADALSSVLHLFLPTENIRLDVRNGDCYQDRDVELRIKLKDLLEIREEIKNKFKCELPPLLTH